MEAAEIKLDLHDKIEHADAEQLKELYGLVVNYFNGTEPLEDWDTLSESEKKRINQSLEQADAGLGTPAKEVVKKIREQYGLNG